jgi:isopentenyl diphosphate isomerase/L-lactate dehydrogenase-like FMN-dependent dehydrogenase
LVARASAAGFSAIVLTVDTPLLGRRERDLRNGFRLPEGIRIENLVSWEDRKAGAAGWSEGSNFWQYVHEMLDASLTWEAVDWLRARAGIPVLLKGILTPEDALLAVEHGADGIVVSNHGGRQLDGAEATIRALPRIVEAVNGRCEVLMDGGVRRGVDVLKALALGARAVLVGRPVLWGLAAMGEEGVVRVLDMLSAELQLAMALAGAPSVRDIGRNLVNV